MAVRHRFKKLIYDLDYVLKINYKLISRIFRQVFLVFIRKNQLFYEILFGKNKKLNKMILNRIIKSFFKFFDYKIDELQYPFHRKKKLSEKMKKEIEIKKKNQKNEIKYKTYPKFFWKRIFVKTTQTKLEKEAAIQKNVLARYFKNKVANRIPMTRDIVRSDKLIVPKLMEFGSFGLTYGEKTNRWILTETKFYAYSRNLCFKFFNRFVPILPEIFDLNKQYLNMYRFNKKIFYYCLAKDFNIKKKKSFLIEDFESNVEDDVNFSKKIDSIKFYSGLSVKFILSRRNCFFQIWNNQGFTIMRITAGFFSRYYKKIYRKIRQFTAFYRFFSFYFGYLLLMYRKNLFRQFVKYRKKITNTLDKVKKRKKIKLKSRNLRYNGLSYLFYYKTHFMLNVVIRMRKPFYGSDFLFNIRWGILFKRFFKIRQVFTEETTKKIELIIKSLKKHLWRKKRRKIFIYKLDLAALTFRKKPDLKAKIVIYRGIKLKPFLLKYSSQTGNLQSWRYRRRKKLYLKKFLKKKIKNKIVKFKDFRKRLHNKIHKIYLSKTITTSNFIKKVLNKIIKNKIKKYNKICYTQY